MRSFVLLATALLAVVLIASPATDAVTYTMTLQTDAASYSGAQTLTASGAVSPPPGPGTAVLIKILNPSGSLVATGAASVNGSTGAYKYAFVLGGSSSWVAGTYSINASWGSSTSAPVVLQTASFTYSPARETTTTSTTQTTTTTSTTSETTTTTSSTTETTSTTTTSTTTTSTQTSTTTTTTPGGGGGIPEFPYQALVTTLFAAAIVASYLLVRRRVMPEVVGPRARTLRCS